MNFLINMIKGNFLYLLEQIDYKRSFMSLRKIIGLIIITGVYLCYFPISPLIAREQIQSVTQVQSDNSISQIDNTDAGENAKDDEMKPNNLSETDGSVAETDESLFATVKQGGPLMIILVILGLISLTIIIERLIFYTRHSVWKADRMVAHLRNAANESSTHFREDMEDEIKNVFSIYANELERGLALLSGIGNIAPIIGFLGTVLGMISAFSAIAAASTVNAKIVAEGIQIALVTTAGGLVVAAPTLTFYYFFTNMIQNRYSMAEEVISQMCENLPRLSDRLCEEEPVEKQKKSTKTVTSKIKKVKESKTK